MKAINVKTGDNAYADVIGQYFEKEFSTAFKPSQENLLDILTEILVGTKEYRFGNAPKPESLVIIRQTIKAAIELNIPIPIMTPWGGRKARPGAALDIAEVSAIRQLVCMDNLIRKYYKPGIYLNVRIEDVNADWLYRDDNGAPEEVEAYSDGMVKLINILRGPSQIFGVRESILMIADDYFEMSKMYGKIIFEYLVACETNLMDPALEGEAKREFQKIGWTGTIPAEQRQYYKDRYKAQYPDLNLMGQLAKMADYFAGSLARYKLGGRANPETLIGGYIQINFVPPVPGAPIGIVGNTLYYRTVGLSNARTHIAPWRAKGFLEINSDGQVKAKICSFGDKERIQELIPGSACLCSEDGSLRVQVASDSFVIDPTPTWASGAIAPYLI